MKGDKGITDQADLNRFGINTIKKNVSPKTKRFKSSIKKIKKIIFLPKQLPGIQFCLNRVTNV
jgi:hypothetical protein